MGVKNKNRNSTAVPGLTGALLIFLLFGCSAEEKHVDSAEQQVPYSSKEGKRLYMHYCAICHGEKGDGAGRYYGFGLEPKPANFTLKEFFEERDDARLYKAISEGSVSVGKSNLCPPWGRTLHKEEMEFLVDYIRTLSLTSD